MGALDTVLDSNARVTPFRILLQVPGSQMSWVIASGELNRPPSRTVTGPFGWVAAAKFPAGFCLVFQELLWRK